MKTNTFIKLHNFFQSFFKKEETMIIESNLTHTLYLILNHTTSTKHIKIFLKIKIVKDTYEFIKDS
ncbi:MAG: hypothetical protein R2837_07780 [Aliarcobacter sp.]